MIWKYPPEFDRFIRETAPGRHDWETAELARAAGWDVTDKQVKCYRNNHGIRNGLTPGDHREHRKFYIVFSAEIEQFIRDHVNGVQSGTLAEMVNREFETNYTMKQIQAFKKNHKLKSDIDTRFVEGSPNVRAQIPKGVHLSPKTEFKKGQKAINRLPIGSVRAREDRSGNPQVYIKLTDTGNSNRDWAPYNRYLWEQEHGPIPEGMCIAYLDGNPKNCVLENLICVPRSAITYVNKNGLKHSDPDMMKTQYLTAMLHNEVKKRSEAHEQ